MTEKHQTPSSTSMSNLRNQRKPCPARLM